MDTLQLGRHRVGDGQPVYVIAEVGINHDGDFATAVKLLEQAAWAGASAVKLQTYITEKRVPKGSPIFDILKKCELSFTQQKELFQRGADAGVDVFSTPFDDESVDFLVEVGAPCFKIASFDIVNRKLLQKVAAQKRPVVVSRGMADQQEIDTAVAVLREHGAPFALLHCVSAYPVASHTDLNLSTMGALKARYGCPVGFSDHTLGIEAPTLAVAAGAELVEKHFTLSKTAPGPDHGMSTEPAELKQMVDAFRRVREMMGRPVWSSIEAEKGILQYRRPS
jgi:sialic acid synthase SpsE